MEMPNINRTLLKRLQAYWLPARPRRCTPECREIYDSSYQLWKDVRKEGLKSQGLLEDGGDISSDEFLRHEEFFALAHDDIVVGIAMCDWMDVDAISNTDHSYLQLYSEQALEYLKNNCPRIMVIAQVMVHPDWRKSKIGPGVTDALTGLVINRLFISNADALVTITRNNRKTNEIAAHFGAIPIHVKHVSYGSESDILVFHREDIHECSIPGLPVIIDEFWQNRVEGIVSLQQDFATPQGIPA